MQSELRATGNSRPAIDQKLSHFCLSPLSSRLLIHATLFDDDDDDYGQISDFHHRLILPIGTCTANLSYFEAAGAILCLGRIALSLNLSALELLQFARRLAAP